MEIGAVDIVIVGWAAGNAVSNGFEQHLPGYRRLATIVEMLSVLTVIDFVAGRVALYVLLSILGIGMMVLHAWCFPKNGGRWYTTEPRSRYLDLIGR
jgi:hypothetical protein